MPIRVVEVPAAHPYTRAVTDAGWTDVRVLADPVEDPAKWWPHPAVEADWWAAQADPAEVCHIHFGFEHRTPQQMRELTETLNELRVKLVVTVHDLDNPHLEDQTDHHARLQILLDHAAATITLTDAAARRIARDFGARAVVLPHPPIVPPAQWQASTGAGACVFIKSIRSNTVQDPDFYRGMKVYAHADVADHPLVQALDDVTLHAPLDDAALYRTLSQHRACVLPYTRGTHSGWLEMCRDLGLNVVVPDCGCYADQADQVGVVFEYPTGKNPAAAVERALAAPTQARVESWTRVTDEVRAAHHRIYREVVA